MCVSVVVYIQSGTESNCMLILHLHGNTNDLLFLPLFLFIFIPKAAKQIKDRYSICSTLCMWLCDHCMTHTFKLFVLHCWSTRVCVCVCVQVSDPRLVYVPLCRSFRHFSHALFVMYALNIYWMCTVILCSQLILRHLIAISLMLPASEGVALNTAT